ncbi:MAG: hypothetical protein ACRD2I_12310 [Vicinamibacterales bacterium]
MILLSAAIVAGAIAWAAWYVGSAMRAPRRESTSDRVTTLLTLFAPALTVAPEDPRTVLNWQPIANAARQLFPDEFASLDRAIGGRFPFAPERLEAAHARWTADWLAWELAHDTEYKLKTAVAAHDPTAEGIATPVVRARLDAIEREKLDLYQRRYSEYVRTAKALQALIESDHRS